MLHLCARMIRQHHRRYQFIPDTQPTNNQKNNNTSLRLLILISLPPHTLNHTSFQGTHSVKPARMYAKLLSIVKRKQRAVCKVILHQYHAGTRKKWQSNHTSKSQKHSRKSLRPGIDTQASCLSRRGTLERILPYLQRTAAKTQPPFTLVCEAGGDPKRP